MRFLIITLGVLGPVTWLGCASSDPSTDALLCDGTSEGLGHWRTFYVPTREVSEEIGGEIRSFQVPRRGASFSDKDNLLFLERGDCDACGWLYELNSDSITWHGQPRTGGHDMEPSSHIVAASPEYVFMQGGTEANLEGGSQWVTWTDTAALLERGSMTWTVHPPPPEHEGRTSQDAQIFWTGEVFGVFGGVTDDVGVPPIYDSTTQLTRHYDGQFFDPVEKAWQRIPPLRPPETHSFGNHDPRQDVTSVWTDAGLFVWGKDKVGAEVIGLLPVDGREWIVPASAKSPPLRTAHSLVHGDGHVYLFGGFLGEAYRDLWRFSLDTHEWSEILVPRYADVSISGAWFHGKLVFVGRCPSNVLYDPQTDTWEKLTSDSAPPGPGTLHVAGNTVFVDSPIVDNRSIDGIWAWTLEPVANPGGMGGVGGAGGGN